jgi:phosphohistidine phosphatase
VKPFAAPPSLRIYLVRHGDAVPEEDAGSDRDRWLSRHGRDSVRVLARLLRDQGLVYEHPIETIVCSPLPRAVQTAELLSDALDHIGVIETLRCLEPSGQPKLASQAILSRGSSVLVVGHEPSLSSLGAYLLGRPSFPPFRTAQACAIEDRRPTFTCRSDLNQTQAYSVDERG